MRWLIPSALGMTVALGGLRADTLEVPSAFASIQAAITAAQTGDVVKVAAGTYNEAIDFSGKKITVVSVSGAADAILDGTNLKLPIVTFKNAEAADSVLDGFTIMNGTGNGSGISSTGGGMSIAAAAPTIRNCIIKQNKAGKGAGIFINGAGAGGVIDSCEITENEGLATSLGAGAGIYVALTGTVDSILTITNTQVTKNFVKTTATPGPQGCGIYLSGTNTKAQVTLTDVTVTENVMGNVSTSPTAAGGDGGGIYMDTVPVVMEGGEVSLNVAYNGGGLALKNQGLQTPSKSSITNVLVRGNQAIGGGGGGIYFPNAFNSKLTLSRVTIQENTAGAAGGGGMLIDSGAPIIDGCQFIENSTTQDGGAIRSKVTSAANKVMGTTFSKNTASVAGGAIYVSSASTAISAWANCIFSGNTSQSGGGGVILKGTNAAGAAKFIYCTFLGNTTTSGVGGIQFEQAGTPGLVFNSILWANSPTDYDGSHTTATNINYCDVKSPVIARANQMFNVDPGFVSAVEPYDFHLLEDSPLVDKGGNPTDASLKGFTVDAEGKDRAQGLGPDLGAFEVGQAPVVKPKFIRGLCRHPGADIQNGTVDIGDPIYLLRWLFIGGAVREPGCLKGCDANDDAAVDINDAVYLLGYLFQGKTAPKAPFPVLGEDPTNDSVTCVEGKVD